MTALPPWPMNFTWRKGRASRVATSMCWPGVNALDVKSQRVVVAGSRRVGHEIRAIILSTRTHILVYRCCQALLQMKKAMLPDQLTCAAFESAILERASLIKLSEVMTDVSTTRGVSKFCC